MSLKNVTITAASLATVIALGTLATTLAPDDVARMLPDWAKMTPAVAWASVILSAALITSVTRFGLASVVLAGLVAIQAGAVLAILVIVRTGGLEEAMSSSTIATIVLKHTPTPILSLALFFLGTAVALRPQHHGSDSDLSVLAGTAAMGLAFLSFVGNLYGASQITASLSNGARSSFLDSITLTALSVCLLSLNPKGLVAGYLGQSQGAVAKRKLLPAVVITPMMLGLVCSVSFRTGFSSPYLMLALAGVANIVVLLVLIEFVGRTISSMAQRQEYAYAQREMAAQTTGMTDALTGLLNRRGWDEQIVLHEQLCKDENKNTCVVMIDLDGLKVINDSQGHKAGDEYIRRAGLALRNGVRAGPLARLGGDEFAYIAYGCEPQFAEVVTNRVRQALFKADVPASVGHALRNNRTLAEAFQEADESMYHIKRARKAQGAKVR